MKPINQTPVSSDAAYERETLINFCDAEKKASYYTRNNRRMQELRELAQKAKLPKKWVKIRPPLQYSEERRAAMVESGKRLAAIAKEKAAKKAADSE